MQRAQLAAQIDLADQHHWITGASSRLDGLAQSFSEFTSGGIAQILDFRGQQLREDLTERMRRHEADVKQAFDLHAGAPETRGAEFETRLASLERRLEEVAASLDEMLDPARSTAALSWDETRIASVERTLEEVAARLDEMRAPPRSTATLSWDVPADQARELRISRMIQDRVREEWSFLLPRTVVGKDLVRLGRDGDGGYVLLNDFENVQACISAGVDTEISFDLALAERNVQVFMFDPAVSDIPACHSGLVFRQVAIGPRSDNGTVTLRDVIQDHGIADYTRSLLKIDIEGAEWHVLNNPTDACLSLFSQILIEFHGMTNFLDHADHLKRLYALRNLSQTHEIVHIHANNWGECAIVGGLSVPAVIETTWVRRTDHEFGPARYEFPTALDYPNNADWAEIAFSLRPLVVTDPA